MGFRMRKSKTIVPGVRISTTGKSASISFGGKAGRVTVNSSGRVTKTAHVPGTNVSYVSSSGGSHAARHSSGKVSHAATKKYDSTKLVYIDPADFAEMSTPDFLAYSDAFLTAAKTPCPKQTKILTGRGRRLRQSPQKPTVGQLKRKALRPPDLLPRIRNLQNIPTNIFVTAAF